MKHFLDEFGRVSNTASIVLELADLEAFYLNDLDRAPSNYWMTWLNTQVLIRAYKHTANSTWLTSTL